MKHVIHLQVSNRDVHESVWPNEGLLLKKPATLVYIDHATNSRGGRESGQDKGAATSVSNLPWFHSNACLSLRTALASCEDSNSKSGESICR